MNKQTTMYVTGDGHKLPAHRPAGERRLPRNVSQVERVFSTVGGSVLLAGGLARGKLSGLLLSAIGGAFVYRGVTGHCHGYEALGIDSSSHKATTAVPGHQGVKVETTLAIRRSPEELYSFWRNVENLPSVMRHLERVEAADANRSHWVAKGPLGKLVEWDAEIFNEHEPELIAWRSLPGGDVETAGSIRFKPLGNERGTAATVSLMYNPPGGKVGAAIARLLGGGLQQELSQDLMRFKSAMEAGEAPTIEGQPRGN